MNPVYGPVPSWRLGKSLGIDPQCSSEKECPFDCIYCQLGKTINKTIERRKYIDEKGLSEALENIDSSGADIITFSGTGEPTLASNLPVLLKEVRRKSGLPVAILTSAALIGSDRVRKELKDFDKVVLKFDAPDEETFQKINQPHQSLRLADIEKGIKEFRRQYSGKLSIQTMFVRENKKLSGALAEKIREFDADEVQLDTPLRPCAVPPLDREEMKEVEKSFSGMKFISVYRKEKPSVKAFDIKETRKRRPAEAEK